jgi:hypothetical protein
LTVISELLSLENTMLMHGKRRAELIVEYAIHRPSSEIAQRTMLSSFQELFLIILRTSQAHFKNHLACLNVPDFDSIDGSRDDSITSVVELADDPVI